ncbi:hypothetical protein ABLE91_04190 [Aquabacter sp. CN5-332]|uniref:hypothetical protein n=1 Tax=Aquabacter sp. CN5-332 TaxID=3156608 RepID=UPI0032B4FA2C
MGMTQLRHLKLWFAGRLENWELAEIKASLQDPATLSCQECPMSEMRLNQPPEPTSSFTRKRMAVSVKQGRAGVSGLPFA